MTRNRDTRIEAMDDILAGLGIKVTPEQIETIVDDFSGHMDMESEMESYAHVGYKEPCRKCERLESQLRSITEERDIYHKNVCIRRKTTDVWIEGDTVMYRK
jgi:hypothetical protein